jgi:hypothetical protein
MTLFITTLSIMSLCITTIHLITLCIMTLYNYILHNDNQQNNTRQNDIWHNGTRHDNKTYMTQHKNIHSKTIIFWMSQKYIMPNVVILNAVMLSVMAPNGMAQTPTFIFSFLPASMLLSFFVVFTSSTKEPCWKGRLSTVDLLVKIVFFTKEKKYIFIYSSWSVGCSINILRSL